MDITSFVCFYIAKEAPKNTRKSTDNDLDISSPLGAAAGPGNLSREGGKDVIEAITEDDVVVYGHFT